MANGSHTTKDHDEIQKWAEERGGKPSHVKSTGSAEDIGILRLDFPGYSGADSLEPISWEQWFEKFDERKLALLYQEETAGGQKSNFNKIVSSETAAENEDQPSKRTVKKVAAKKAAPKKAAGKKVVAKKAPAKKVAPKKVVAKEAAAKKAAPKKTVAKKSPVKKVAAKKAPVKKVAAKKAAVKKAAPKKVAVKKAAPKKAVSKKAVKKSRR